MAMFGGATPSVADIAAVTRNNGDGNFGDGNGWWILIILFAIFGGWGNGNWGGNGNGGAYGVDASMQRGFDTQAIISKLDGLSQGLCDLGYASLSQANGLERAITTTGFGLQQAINQGSVDNMQNTNALSRQLADCCCENRAAIAQVRYDMSTEACATRAEIHQTGDAIMRSQDAGFQMLNNTINDRFTRLEIAQKDQYIAELERKLNACDRDSALQGTASYIINSVRPTPGPAWIVDNPNACNCGRRNYCDDGCGRLC